MPELKSIPDDMKHIDLKPCPFCETDEGLSIERSEPQPGWPLFYVHCDKCGVNSVPELTVEESIEEWNYSISEGYLGGEGYENEWKAEVVST